MTVRWRFEDPAGPDEVILPLNPNEMSSPSPGRSVQSAWTSRWVSRGTSGADADDGFGRPRLIDSGQLSPIEWSFGGVIRNESHYELLLEWTKACRVLRVTDHLGRTFEIIIQKFDPVERRPTPTNEWRANYTMNCLLLKRIP